MLLIRDAFLIKVKFLKEEFVQEFKVSVFSWVISWLCYVRRLRFI